MKEESKYRLEQIHKLLLAIWNIEDKHNDEYSDRGNLWKNIV
jgi:hypothetical protein